MTAGDDAGVDTDSVDRQDSIELHPDSIELHTLARAGVPAERSSHGDSRVSYRSQRTSRRGHPSGSASAWRSRRE